MPAKNRSRVVRGTAAARRAEPITIMPVYENMEHWGHQILPLLSHEAEQRDWRLLRGWYPKDFKIDGALTDCGPGDEDVDRLLAHGCPVVQLSDTDQLKTPRLPSVLFDCAANGRLAADHFHDRGFRHVGITNTEPWEVSCELALAGFRDRADELGMECHELHFSTGPGRSRETRTREEFTGFVRQVAGPVGIFAASDIKAASLCLRAYEAEIHVPTEVGLLGSGNSLSICECTFPKLSSVEYDEEHRVHEACELLARLMTGKPAPAKAIMIPPKGIVERESTDVLATPDPHVAAALRYMWDHLDLDLSVDDIAGEVGVSRQKLERGFRKHLDRGINEELRRKRLEVFRQLLSTTDVPITELAPMVGFRTMVHLQRSFRRAFGMSPRQWRARSGG